MDGRIGDLPPTTRLRPKQLGRGLPVPPVLALAVVISLFAGIALGYRVAPRTDPPPSPSPSPTMARIPAVESSSPSASPAASLVPADGPSLTAYDVPPAGGLTLSEALAAFNEYLAKTPGAARAIGPGVSESAVVYARVERYNDLPSLFDSPEEWVWAIGISGSFGPADCGGSVPAGRPCPGSATTAMIILDYNTGALRVTWSPAFP